MRLIDADELKEQMLNFAMCKNCPNERDRCSYECNSLDCLAVGLERVIDAQPTVPTIVWHPYPDEIPPRDGRYLVTVAYVSGSKIVMSLYYQASHDYPWLIAWAEMPEPYDGRR